MPSPETASVELPPPEMSARDRSAHGFSLVEVTVALGLAAFGLLGIFALLPVGLNSSTDSVNTTLATGIATAIASDLQSARPGESSLIYGLKPDAPGVMSIYLKADGSPQTSPSSADFRANITVAPSTSTEISQIRIAIYWPALAANPANSFEVVTAHDRSPAL